MEEPAQGVECPLFRFPPLTPLPLLFVLRHYFIRDPKIYDLEEELTPGHDRLWALLVRTQVHSDASFVGLEDEMKHSWGFLSSARWSIK